MVISKRITILAFDLYFRFITDAISLENDLRGSFFRSGFIGGLLQRFLSEGVTAKPAKL
jgi:hypothetical protein